MRTETLLTVQEAARHIGISRDAIYKAIDAGNLHWWEIEGKRYLLLSEVERYQPNASKRRKEGD